MSPDFDQKLCAKYPKIFVHRRSPMTETCMCWGFECGNGWFTILDGMCEAFANLYTGADSTAADGVKGVFSYTAPTVIADQVKEKYGTLRFQYHLEFTPEFEAQAAIYPKTAIAISQRYAAFVDGIVCFGEVMSTKICEESGLPGEMHVTGGHPNGWYKTLNREVAKQGWFAQSNYLPASEMKVEKDPETKE